MSLRIISISLLVVFLTACGGGGSSSGASTAPEPAPLVSIDGDYSGSWTATISAPGIPSETESLLTLVTITNGVITISDGVDVVSTGTITATNGFDAISPVLSTTVDGIPCQGEFTFSGIVDPVAQTVSGNGRAQLSCTFRGQTIRIDIVGPFTASRAAAKLSGKSLNQAFLNFLR